MGRGRTFFEEKGPPPSHTLPPLQKPSIRGYKRISSMQGTPAACPRSDERGAISPVRKTRSLFRTGLCLALQGPRGGICRSLGATKLKCQTTERRLLKPALAGPSPWENGGNGASALWMRQTKECYISFVTSSSGSRTASGYRSPPSPSWGRPGQRPVSIGRMQYEAGMSVCTVGRAARYLRRR